MIDASEPPTTRPIRRDGWTPERRGRFLEFLAAGIDVRRACAGVGLSRESAYKLRRREPAFAQAWDEALQSARAAAEEAFLALLPEWLLRTLSELSGPCELHVAGEIAPRTLSELSGVCEHGGRRSGRSGHCQSCGGSVNFRAA